MKTQFFNKNKRKYGLLIISILLLGVVVFAYNLVSEPELLAGYILLEENILYLDEVEVITTEDKDRIVELDLKDEDLPNGYYIHNRGKETILFELTDETVYTFIDYQLLFVEEPSGDRLYKTTKKENFVKHLNTSYFDEPPAGKVPFFIEVKNGKAISVTEKFLFTQ